MTLAISLYDSDMRRSSLARSATALRSRPARLTLVGLEPGEPDTQALSGMPMVGALPLPWRVLPMESRSESVTDGEPVLGVLDALTGSFLEAASSSLRCFLVEPAVGEDLRFLEAGPVPPLRLALELAIAAATAAAVADLVAEATTLGSLTPPRPWVPAPTLGIPSCSLRARRWGLMECQRFLTPFSDRPGMSSAIHFQRLPKRFWSS
mmetsp:Transcript_19861/g.50175  ORF Transcript_19861/g.50175 Transcript_19861/m.50175 type:complete len:208 (+) Transcript_19861:606-1229(+)